MNRFIFTTAASIALWGVWLLGSQTGNFIAFDGLAFLFAAISSSQLIVLATRNPQVDAFKTLLVLQTLLNVGVLGAAALGLEINVVRSILMYATLGQLVIAYSIVFQRRKSTR